MINVKLCNMVVGCCLNFTRTYYFGWPWPYFMITPAPTRTVKPVRKHHEFWEHYRFFVFVFLFLLGERNLSEDLNFWNNCKGTFSSHNSAPLKTGYPSCSVLYPLFVDFFLFLLSCLFSVVSFSSTFSGVAGNVQWMSDLLLLLCALYILKFIPEFTDISTETRPPLVPDS